MIPIIIEPGNPEWANEFKKIKAYLWPHVCDIAIDIIHIGSTSVPGLAAKPIIDFNIVIESYDVFEQLKERLNHIGYEHDGDGGLPMRERFTGGAREGYMDYNMYVSPIESRILLAQVLFSDYLCRHNDYLTEYAVLKQTLAKQHRNDIVAYVNGKHEFIMNLVDLAIKEKQAEFLNYTGKGNATGIIDQIITYHQSFITAYQVNQGSVSSGS